MKIQDGTQIDVLYDDVDNYKTGRTNKGVQIQIEGELCLRSRQNHHHVTLWLTQAEAKELIKEIKEEFL